MAVILCTGFDPGLYSLVRIEGRIDRSTTITTLRASDLLLTMEEISQKAALRGNIAEEASPLSKQHTGRYVIFDGERKDLNKVMSGFRKAYKPAAGSVIFAMLTDTARKWTLEAYLKELGEEHQEMKQYRAQTADSRAEGPIMKHK